MVNQQKIIPMERLHGVIIDIEAAKAVVGLKVIEISNDSNPYPTLLKVDWDFDMNAINNLKKQSMVFEKNELRVIVLLDPAEGARYTELNRDYYEDDEIEHIYKLTAWNEDWINTTMDGRINWEKEKSFQSDLDEELEN